MSTAVEIAVLRQLLIKCLKVYKAHHLFFSRHRQTNGKNAAVELADMADSNSVDSKEEQDTSVDNVCYDKVYIKQRSGKSASVELTDMVDKGSTESKEEQDMDTSVDNICYDQLPSKLYQGYMFKP